MLKDVKQVKVFERKVHESADEFSERINQFIIGTGNFEEEVQIVTLKDPDSLIVVYRKEIREG